MSKSRTADLVAGIVLLAGILILTWAWCWGPASCT